MIELGIVETTVTVTKQRRIDAVIAVENAMYEEINTLLGHEILAGLETHPNEGGVRIFTVGNVTFFVRTLKNKSVFVKMVNNNTMVVDSVRADHDDILYIEILFRLSQLWYWFFPKEKWSDLYHQFLGDKE